MNEVVRGRLNLLRDHPRSSMATYSYRFFSCWNLSPGIVTIARHGRHSPAAIAVAGPVKRHGERVTCIRKYCRHEQGTFRVYCWS